MKQNKFKIIDSSGDKDFFTVIPNFIINHSTAIDRALYLEMKRFAGEDGQCFATQETMMKRLEIGRKTFKKSLDYLEKKGWVTFIGLTGGKTRPVKTYKVNNIWQEKSDYYKKIPAKRTVSLEGDTVQKSSKIPAERTVEEDPCKEDIILSKDNISDSDESQGKTLNNLMDKFSIVNPSVYRLFPNKNQRAALERLLNQYGREKLEKIINFLPRYNSVPYNGTAIIAPYELEVKMGKVIGFVEQMRNKQFSKGKKIISSTDDQSV